MGQRIETSLKRRDAALTALRDTFSSGRLFHWTSERLEQERHKTLERHGIAKCPHWVRSYLDGTWRQLVDTAYRQDLVYGGFYQGRFYSTHNNRPDYYGKHGIEPHEYADDGAVSARGHYWIKSVDNGVPHPFFIG